MKGNKFDKNIFFIFCKPGDFEKFQQPPEIMTNSSGQNTGGLEQNSGEILVKVSG